MPQAAQKQDQEVEEKETDEVEVEVLETEEQEKPEVEVETQSKPEQSGDELEQYSEGVKKRISKLTAKMREAERREQAAIQYAQAAKKELEENQKKNLSLDNSYVSEFENRIKLQDQLYRNTLKEAIDRGDVDGQVEAQRQLANVASQNDKLAMVKQQQEQRARQPVPVQQPMQQQRQPAPPDPKAAAWADKNDWFGTDEPMTLTAFSIHKTLVESEGWDPHSDDYYAEVDKRIRQEFPHKFGGATRQSGPVVASASRGGQKKGKQKIQLTKSEVAIADKLGVSYEQYARQKARMQNT